MHFEVVGVLRLEKVLLVPDSRIQQTPATLRGWHVYSTSVKIALFFYDGSPGMPYPHTWLKAQFLAMRSICFRIIFNAIDSLLFGCQPESLWHFLSFSKFYLD